MSQISEILWHSEFPDTPMPNDCTYDQFAAACDAKWADDRLESSSQYIGQLKQQRDKTSDPVKRDLIQQMIDQELDQL